MQRWGIPYMTLTNILLILRKRLERAHNKSIKEIFSRITTITKYFFFEEKISDTVKKHLELERVLQPFKAAGLINHNTYNIYLFSYLAKFLSTGSKLQSLIHHYSFLSKNFSEQQLQQIFSEGVECYREYNGQDLFTIVLIWSSTLEHEGSLSLFFKVNNVKTANLSFTFVPGKLFGMTDETIIYVSCLQRIGNEFDNVIKCKIKDHFNDITPAVILLKSLEAVAYSLHIKQALCVSAINQLSFIRKEDYEKFYTVYDQFWQLMGGELVNESYAIPFPVPQKNILLVKQTHRNRARKKRKVMNDIYIDCYSNINSYLSGLTPMP